MRRARYFPPLVALLLLAACREAKVTSYTIPKEEDAQASTVPANAASTNNETAPVAAPDATASNPLSGAMTAPVPTDEGPGLAWTAPSDWQSAPAGPMRKATYRIAGPEGRAELSITAFPGDVGGELANVNRWRGQVGLPPLDAGTLDQNVSRTEVNGLTVTMVDLGDATSPHRILGAIVPYSGGVWFFKLTGPGALLERTKPAFLRFVQTLKAAAS